MSIIIWVAFQHSLWLRAPSILAGGKNIDASFFLAGAAHPHCNAATSRLKFYGWKQMYVSSACVIFYKASATSPDTEPNNDVCKVTRTRAGKRECGSGGGLSSSDTPTITSWRSPHHTRDTLRIWLENGVSGCDMRRGITGGEGAWKPMKTSSVHCRLWLNVPTTYPPITDWVHSKCSCRFQVEHMIWVHLCNILNVILTCAIHFIPHNS